MDRWHSASALEDPPAVSVAEGKPHEPDSSRSPDPEDSSHRALAAITSFIAAFAMAYMLCRLPLTRTLSWPAVIFRSTLYIALTVAAGVATVRFARLSSDKRSIKPLRMCSNLAVGWAFLPPILLLYRQDSPWILLPVALLTLSAVWGLRQIFPAAIEPEPLPQRPAGDLPSLYGLPPADSHLVRTFCIALCAQASLLLAAGDYLFIAGLLLSLSLALTLRSATDPAAARWWIGTRPPSRSVALAITLAVLALLPWVANRPSFPGRIGGPPNPPPAARQPTESESPSSDYVGIVLWPPPVKKTSIAPPAPHSQSFASGVASKPVVIPFDGPYW